MMGRQKTAVKAVICSSLCGRITMSLGGTYLFYYTVGVGASGMKKVLIIFLTIP